MARMSCTSLHRRLPPRLMPSTVAGRSLDLLGRSHCDSAPWRSALVTYGQRVTDAERVLGLWDVDGTLIHNGGVSKQAYRLGFERLAGQPTAVPVVTDGMTDGAIMASLFERNDLEMNADHRARLYEVMAA